jgi:flagellum-specific ATP synthase
MLPRLMERSGMSDKGSITAFYTVLVDGDDFNEPIADAVRGILDGHIVLSRDLAAKNHYPAIDIMASISRLMSEIADGEHKKSAAVARELLATYKNSEDLINLGAYAKGSNKKIDVAINYHENIIRYLKQGMNEKSDFEESVNTLKKMFN